MQKDERNFTGGQGEKKSLRAQCYICGTTSIKIQLRSQSAEKEEIYDFKEEDGPEGLMPCYKKLNLFQS